MDVIVELGRDVDATVVATYGTYGDILRQPTNSSRIHRTKITTFSYGPHTRHKLDLYRPDSAVPSPIAGRARPILIYIYGGAFMFGDRVLSEIPGNVVYKNIGSFFADRLGYNVVVIDYLLVKHGAKYPSGGQDLDYAIEWLLNYFHEDRDVFLMGHSAGASHVATWLFNTEFHERRNRLISSSTGLTLRGAIFLSAPFTLSPGLELQFEGYYGDPTLSRKVQPTALVRDGMKHGRFPNIGNWPPLLALVSEMDPEIVHDAADDFKRSWREAGGKVEVQVLKHHNHHSPPLSLGTNREEEEAWGLPLMNG
jgi:Esterase/lipase